MTNNSLSKRILLWTLLSGWLLFALGPYIWMLLTSFKPMADLFSMPIRYLPTTWTLGAYTDLIEKTSFMRFMKNSIILALLTTLLTLLIAIPAGFSLSRHQFRAKRVILSLLIMSQFFPSILLILALFPLMKNMGLLQSLTGLVIVYSAFVTPFVIWLIKGFFDNIPKEVDEAAKIDGCSEIQLLRQVLLPVVVPGIVASAAYIVIYSWNEFLFAVTFASNTKANTLPVGMKSFIGDYVTRWDLLTAGGVVSAIPILVFFMLIQRRLISGLTSGAVKS